MLGATKVILFDHTVRKVERPGEETPDTPESRKPVVKVRFELWWYRAQERELTLMFRYISTRLLRVGSSGCIAMLERMRNDSCEDELRCAVSPFPLHHALYSR